MFKNLTLYRMPMPWERTTAEIETALQPLRFTKCGASQEKSVGWIEPRGHDNGPLVECIDGHIILKLAVETKTVPTRAVSDKVDERVKDIEATTGRKPGKKERRDIADDARIALLPMAFTKLASIVIWIDTKAQLLAMDAGSVPKADEAVTYLIKTFEGLILQGIHTQTSPSAAMAHWLSTKEDPQSFSVDQEVELKAADESKAVVRYKNHNLDTDEVALHIAQGKLPTKLALTWNTRVSFILTEELLLKKIAFLDVVMESARATHAGKEDAFDADVAIATGELSGLIPDLLEALGGLTPGSHR